MGAMDISTREVSQQTPRGMCLCLAIFGRMDTARTQQAPLPNAHLTLRVTSMTHPERSQAKWDLLLVQMTIYPSGMVPTSSGAHQTAHVRTLLPVTEVFQVVSWR